MKKIHKILAVVLALCAVLSISITGFAADRHYTIRVFAGDQGSLASPYTIPYNGNSASIPLDSLVTVKNPSKYTIVGLREAGKGTGTYHDYEKPISKNIYGSVIISDVQHDTDYVVAYAIASSVVDYEVRYLEQGTNTDLSSQVTLSSGETRDSIRYFKGVQGTRIAVSARYIEGYTPVYPDGTVKTLSADSTKNIFPVYYTRTPTTTGGTTVVATGGGGVAAAGNANANANTATANANANSVNPQPGYTPTETILDLDVPLAEFEGPAASVAPVLVPFADVNGDTAQRRLPNWMTIALIVVLAGLIAALYWYLLFYRKKKKYANEVDYDFSFLDDDDHDDYR